MERSEDDANSEDQSPVWQIFVLAVAAAFTPLLVVAGAGETPNPWSLLVGFLLLFGLAALIRQLVVLGGGEPVGASQASAVFVLIVSSTGFFAERLSFGRVLMLLAAATIGILSYRLRNLPLFRVIATWFFFAVLVYPLVLIVSRMDLSDDLNVDVGASLQLGQLTGHPDIVLIVLDAYANESVLREFYGYTNQPFAHRLAELGFTVEDDVVSNYGLTQLSVPSLVELDYVAGPHEISKADIRALMGVLGGSSRLAGFLRQNGYRQVYVESGWLGTRCTEDVDECVPARWPDETMYDMAYRTLLRGLPGFEVGISFTKGARRVTEWLEEDLAGYLTNETPEFIYAHVLLPHPPLFLDSGCRLDTKAGMDGFVMGAPWASEAELELARSRYLEQIECVNRTLLTVAEATPHDVFVIMAGDHGPDSLGQLYFDGDPWDEAQIRERFGVFLATKGPACDMTGVESLVNVGRRLVACLSGTDLPDLDLRIFNIERPRAGVRVIEMEPPVS